MSRIKPLNNKVLGQLAFFLLFFMSLVYYIERTTYVDPAFSVFVSIYEKAFVMRAGRLVASLPQLFPLVAIWMHLPLKLVMLFWSAGFVVIYYVVYLVVARVFKKEEIALGVPLVLMLGINYSYFWISTETQQAMVYCVMLFGFLSYSPSLGPGYRNLAVKFVAGTSILLLCFLSHPVAAFPVLFIMGYFIIDRRKWKDPELYLLAAAILAAAVIKLLTVPKMGYEDRFFIDFFNAWKNIGNLGKSGSWHFFRVRTGNLYLFPVIMFFSTVLFYAFRKHFLKMTYYLFAVLLFAMTMFATFPDEGYAFLMEKTLMPLMVFILLPFLKDVVFNSHGMSLLKQVILIGAFLLTVVSVVLSSSFIRDRNTYVLGLLDETRRYPERKFILDEKYVDFDRLNTTWGIAPESLLLSSMESPDSARTIYLLAPADTVARNADHNNPDIFLSTPWYPNILDIKRFDKRYFNLNNSTYRQLRVQDVFDGKSGGEIFRTSFGDAGPGAGRERVPGGTDTTSYFLMKPGYSPGYTGILSAITPKTSAYISASVWVCPLGPVDTRDLILVLSHEVGPEVREYLISGNGSAEMLKQGSWTNLTVSGFIRREGAKDLVKVYVWNRSVRNVLLKEMTVSYNVN